MSNVPILILLGVCLCVTAKIDVNVDLTHKLCASLMLTPFRFLLNSCFAYLFLPYPVIDFSLSLTPSNRSTGSPLSLVIGR